MNDYQTFLLQCIRSGLQEIAGLLRTVPPESLDRELKRGEWSVRRHAHHLRQIEGRYLERLEGIVERGGGLPPPVQHLEPAADEPMEAMLAGYLDAGQQAAAIFERLSEHQWQAVFNHPTIWGDVTVEWWAERFIQHTAEHIDELWMLKQLAGLTPEAYDRVRRGAQ